MKRSAFRGRIVEILFSALVLAVAVFFIVRLQNNRKNDLGGIIQDYAHLPNIPPDTTEIGIFVPGSDFGLSSQSRELEQNLTEIFKNIFPKQSTLLLCNVVHGENATLVTCADELAKFLDDLTHRFPKGHFTLIGHSEGALIGTEAMMRCRAKVRLVLISCPIELGRDWMEDQFRSKINVTCESPAERAMWICFYHRTISYLFDGGMDSPDMAFVKEIQKEESAAYGIQYNDNSDLFLATLISNRTRYLLRYKAWESLRTIKYPFTAIYGDKDELINIGKQKRLLAQIKMAKVKTVHGADHFLTSGEREKSLITFRNYLCDALNSELAH